MLATLVGVGGGNFVVADNLVEVPAGYYLFSGYGVEIAHRFENRNYSVGAVLAGIAEVPNVLKPLFYSSTDLEKLNINWKRAIGLQAKYFFDRTGNSYYLGAIIADEQWILSGGAHSVVNRNVLVTLAPGALFQPFKNQRIVVDCTFYLMANIDQSGPRKVDSIIFEQKRLTAAGNVLFGYRF